MKNSETVYEYKQMSKKATMIFKADKVEDIVLGMAEFTGPFSGADQFEKLIKDLPYKKDPNWPEDRFLYLNEGSSVICYERGGDINNNEFSLEYVNVDSVIERLV